MSAISKDRIIKTAGRLGFALCRVTTADPIPAERLEGWLRSDFHGEMKWLARDPRARCDPASLLPGARSVICLAYPYGENGISVREPKTGSRNQKLIARFARGEDYHDVVRSKLEIVADEIKTQNKDAKTKCCVDTSPVLEKALAERAGIGWIGKNTLLINPKFGSWFVLGEIVTTRRIEPDPPCAFGCGACDLCVKACPTRALNGETLDARRCISYLTVEKPAAKDPFLAKHIEAGTYGCDLCQESCPYNKGMS